MLGLLTKRALAQIAVNTGPSTPTEKRVAGSSRANKLKVVLAVAPAKLKMGWDSGRSRILR